MTREEVTKHLNILLANRCCDCRYERAGDKVCDEKCVFKQAVNEAIEALSADVVSREEAIQAIDKCRERKNKEIEQLREFYSQKPTIPCFAESAEAYKAWTGEEIGTYHYCTNCGELYKCDCQDDVNDFVWNAHYCINCGADMRGEKNGDK